MRSMCKALLEMHTSTNFCNPCYNPMKSLLLGLVTFCRWWKQCTERSSYWPKVTQLLSSRTGFKCKQAGWLQHLCSSPLYFTADTVTRTFHCCCCCYSVAKSCLTLVTPWTVCSPPGSSVHGILQARKLEWVATPFSRGSSGPKDQIRVSCTGRWIIDQWATWEAQNFPLHLGKGEWPLGQMAKPTISKY